MTDVLVVLSVEHLVPTAPSRIGWATRWKSRKCGEILVRKTNVCLLQDRVQLDRPIPFQQRFQMAIFPSGRPFNEQHPQSLTTDLHSMDHAVVLQIRLTGHRFDLQDIVELAFFARHVCEVQLGGLAIIGQNDLKRCQHPWLSLLTERHLCRLVREPE